MGPDLREVFMTPSGKFERLATPLRAELIAYYYRMVGSADEAEDLAQETYLANSQPAFASYLREHDGTARAHAIQALEAATMAASPARLTL